MYSLPNNRKDYQKSKRRKRIKEVREKILRLPPVPREKLKQLIRTTPFLKIGKQLGVSDNAIRKWCDKYKLPRRVSEIKKYTDEEWEEI